MKLLTGNQGKKNEKIKALEKCIKTYPNQLYRLSDLQLEKYHQYLELLLTPKEQLYCNHYVLDSETAGNKIASYYASYNVDRVEDTRSPEYKVVWSAAAAIAKKPRIKAFVEFLHYKRGSNIRANLELANSKLARFIEQEFDDKLSMEAIKHLHKLLGEVNDNTFVQINQQSPPEEEHHYDNLTTEELTEYIRLTKKLRGTEVQQAEIVEDQEVTQKP